MSGNADEYPVITFFDVFILLETQKGTTLGAARKTQVKFPERRTAESIAFFCVCYQTNPF